jgi:uncharacterized membrane protein YfcA
VPISVTIFIIAFAVVMVGATVQGAIGFGTNLVAVPVIAIIAPKVLPGGMVAVAFPMSIAMAWHDRAHLDWQGFRWASIGRIPGLIAGLVVLALVSEKLLGALAGAVVLLGVVVSLRVTERPITERRALTAGAVIGFMGSTAAIEGPPLGLLYQHRPGPEVRSTLAVIFLLGSIITLASLAVTGHLAWWQIEFSVVLWPAIWVGVIVGRRLHPHIDNGRLRIAMLAFSFVMGTVAIIRAVVA